MKRLFIGTEGSFGLITEVTIRCYLKPGAESVSAYSFKSFEKAIGAVLKIRENDLVPASIDTSAEGYEDGPCTLYVVFAGLAEQVSLEERKCRELLSSHGGRALSDGEASSYWEERHQVADFYEKNINRSPFADWRGEKTFDFLHVALPASEIVPFRRGIVRIAKRHRITIESYGIWIKPELFATNFTREDKDSVPTENLRLTVDEGMRLAMRLGGSFEYCHGVGVRLGDLMPAQHKNGLAVMKKMKKALDPQTILNPGKLGL